MRNFMVACSIIVALQCPAFAQISRSDFLSKIDVLISAIDKKYFEGQNSAIGQLNSTMNTQIAYLKPHIETLTAAYNNAISKATSDQAAATAEQAKADEELKKAQTAMNNGTTEAQKDIYKAQSDDIKAKNDLAAAHAERKKAEHDKADIDAANAHLVTEQQSYDEIQHLKGNIPANKDKIIADLKSFAGTLQ